MPFVTTTKRRGEPTPLFRGGKLDVVSRSAVATLEKARGECADYGECILDEQMPASGWTIGPLPDGTVIEVKPATWAAFMSAEEIAAGWPNDPERCAYAIDRANAAYNAAQEAPAPQGDQVRVIGPSQRDLAAQTLAEFERDGFGHWLDNADADVLRDMVRVCVERHRGAVEAVRAHVDTVMPRDGQMVTADVIAASCERLWETVVGPSTTGGQ